MRHLYTLLIYLFTPVAVGYFLFRGISDRRWWRRLRERFGFIRAEGVRGGIWVHAVSVGEVNAATPLVRALRQRWPDVPLTMSCLTPTGSERISSLYGRSVHHIYVPIDLPGAVRRAFDSIRPKILIVMETEIWPNLFERAEKKGVPILIANARLTERSARSWGRFQSLVSRTLRRVNLIAAQTGADAARFVDLGAVREKTRLCGNLKFDITLPDTVLVQGLEWRKRWGPERTILVAGSTHELDETLLMTAFEKLRSQYPDALLIMAPRYPERFSRVAERVSAAGFKVGKLSEAEAPGEDLQCLIVDRMGELLEFYAAADIAFVGGTLAPVGGHNPLEAAALGRPLILGPHNGHIRDLAASLLEAEAAIEVTDAESLYQAWLVLQSDPQLRARMGQAAQKLVDQQRGAVDHTMRMVETLLLE